MTKSCVLCGVVCCTAPLQSDSPGAGWNLSINAHGRLTVSFSFEMESLQVVSCTVVSGFLVPFAPLHTTITGGIIASTGTAESHVLIGIMINVSSAVSLL